MLKLPSATRSHPSKMGTTACPELKRTCSSVDCDCASSGAAATTIAATRMMLFPLIDVHSSIRNPQSATSYCGCDAVVLVFFTPLRASNSALYSSSLRSYHVIHAKPISSIVRWPLPTQLRGSGFAFVAELSCHEITCRIVPAG